MISYSHPILRKKVCQVGVKPGKRKKLSFNQPFRPFRLSTDKTPTNSKTDDQIKPAQDLDYKVIARGGLSCFQFDPKSPELPTTAERELGPGSLH